MYKRVRWDWNRRWTAKKCTRLVCSFKKKAKIHRRFVLRRNHELSIGKKKDSLIFLVSEVKRRVCVCVICFVYVWCWVLAFTSRGQRQGQSRRPGRPRIACWGPSCTACHPGLCMCKRAERPCQPSCSSPRSPACRAPWRTGESPWSHRSLIIKHTKITLSTNKRSLHRLMIIYLTGQSCGRRSRRSRRPSRTRPCCRTGQRSRHRWPNCRRSS